MSSYAKRLERGFDVTPGCAARKLMTDDHMRALQRFVEICEDGQGYDVSQSMMKDLAKIGAVSHIVRGIYEITSFGECLLDSPCADSTDEIAKLKGEAAKSERRAQAFDAVIANHVIAMQAAVIEFRLTGKAEDAINWIENTLAGPGFYPDIAEAEKMGGAQAWFDAKMAEEDARVAALPKAAPQVAEAKQADENTRLQGEAGVLKALLALSRRSMAEMVADDSHEQEMVDALVDKIDAALGSVPVVQFLPADDTEGGDWV